MTLVPLAKLRPNPWRDLETYPIEDDQVARLLTSVQQHGFLGGIKARPDGNGGWELACGHHRIEAAKQSGLREVDIVVGAMDEDEMIGLMCTENATQRGGAVAAAVVNEVGAVVKRLGHILSDGYSGNVWGNNHRLFESQRAFDVAKGTLRKGDGIGRPLVTRYLNSVGDKLRSTEQIKEALATLKECGIYDRIMQGFIVESEPQSEPPPPPPPRIFDERCVRLFPTESQAHAFRKAVTTQSAQRFILVSDQLALAREIAAELKRTDPTDAQGTGRRGATFVKTYVAGKLREAIEAQRQINAEERRQLMLQQRELEFKSRIDDIRTHGNSLAGDFVRLNALLKDEPEFWQHREMGRLSDKLDSWLKALNQFKREAEAQRRRR